MATVKAVLLKKMYKNGTQPLSIRITENRKSSFIYTGYRILAKDWDPINQRVRKSHPNSTRLNNFILHKLTQVTDKSLEVETSSKVISSRAMKKKVKPDGGTSFFTQASLYLKNLKDAGKYNRYTADKPRVEHFKNFLQGSDILFTEITISLLERFQTYLKYEYKISERTIVNHLVVIRSIFSQAIKEEVADKQHYPFGKGKIRIKFPDSLKVGLTHDEVKQVEEVRLPQGSFENHARNLWLFSFYLAGMRVSDVLRLKWTDIKDDRLFYAMGKNSKGGSLKMPEKALQIVNQYREERRSLHDFIFPELKQLENPKDTFYVQRRIAHSASRIDKYLRNHVAPAAKIEKKLTMHIARHTFGNISGDRIPIQMLQKLYRHSHITTTIGYQSNFMFKDADMALEKVLNEEN